MKFVHCADVHLDSPLRGLNAYEGAPVDAIRGATRKAFDNIIDLCLDEGADFLIIAGDLYDGEWPDFNTGLYFAKQMARLGQRGIPAYVVRGNHDAESRIMKKLPAPENVHVFDARRPETFTIDRLKVALHGQSFARRDTMENLATMYPPPERGFFNVGVLHTAIEGREGHGAYAPCGLDQLRTRGYDYWALGHVHRREELCESPWIVFPGNVQGRHARETGAKGCTVVTSESGRTTAEHRSVDVLRWATLTIDATGAETPDDVLDRVRSALSRERANSDGRFLAARIRVEGRTAAHDAMVRQPDAWKQQVRATGLEIGQNDVWTEKVEMATEPPLDVDAVRRRDDAIGELLRAVRELTDDPVAFKALCKKIEPLLTKLPHDVREGVGVPDLANLDEARGLLADAERLLMARIGAWDTTS